MPASRAQRAKTADRRTKAIALRLAGLDWQAIADQLDYADRGSACKDVTRAMEANLAEEKAAVALLRDVEAQRLDRLQAAVWPNALKGDTKSVEAALRIIDRRAKLLGLDAPQRLEVDGGLRYEIVGIAPEDLA